MRSIPWVALATLVSISLPGAASPTLKAGPAAKTYHVELTASAAMTGAPELAGDTDASGMVELTVDPDRKRICYDFNVAGLATPLMAHIHRGTEQHVGPSVVTLFTGPGADLDGCLMWTEKWLAEIVSNPADFYVNLYTTEYPDGALRGQLVG